MRMESFHPTALLIFFMGVLLPAMMSQDPVLHTLSLLSAVCFTFLWNGWDKGKDIRWFFSLPLLCGLGNPLFSHNGATVLFVMNDKPMTLESMLYGACFGWMLVSLLLWFRLFSRIFTSDKILYLLGRISPKLSLILSMTLRYLPLYRQQAQKVKEAQIAMGQFHEETLWEKIRSSLQVFSIMVTWALENGAVTADSMEARGYGVGRRTSFHLFTWKREDGILTAVSLVLGGITVLGLVCSWCGVAFFPSFSLTFAGGRTLLTYGSYLLLTSLPTILIRREERLWKSYLSNI